MLEVDGKKYIESRAILAYVCALTGNLPSTPLETLSHNMLMDKFEGLWQTFLPMYAAITDEEKTKIGEQISPSVREYLKEFDAMLTEHTGEPSHILKGKSYCPMDLILYATVRTFQERPFGIDIGNVEEEYPAVYSIYKGVLDSNPKIKAYHSA
eukprot:Protomagalhaensia_wolfi_Nauph_80__5497@NODE_602_length_2224_cov_2893_632494_g451_i0_p2_GENE_NODE_602_length_2224_cov_2893_632494_g451_i0NODE_602_length_2224_cov_2893_632494_g451_i0_p2_ORF_typecomplete_len154_score31_19GST_C_3/PF14497_6/1_7e06_NODE_602_length_2224_cov_2893_632494_g451_i015211982